MRIRMKIRGVEDLGLRIGDRGLRKSKIRKGVPAKTRRNFCLPQRRRGSFAGDGRSEMEDGGGIS